VRARRVLKKFTDTKSTRHSTLLHQSLGKILLRALGKNIL
jgi:hypothetical protein